MKEKFKLGHRIYVILAFVLVGALLIQFTRSNVMLVAGGEMNEWVSPREEETTSALTDVALSQLDEEKILILYDGTEEYSNKVKSNAEQMLKYMKKQFESRSVYEYKEQGEGFDSIIITFTNLDKMIPEGWIDDYVMQGGTVLFATMPRVGDNFYQYYRKMGIEEHGEIFISKGLIFKSNLLINFENERFSGDIIENTALQIRINPDSRVHLISEEETPLLWDISHGKGRFIVFNGTMLQEKSSRGVLSGAISLLKEDNIYPVMNMKLMFIDDFPAPFPVGTNDTIYRTYRKTMAGFFKDIWWPDMIRIGSHYGLKYTGVVIQSYDNKVNPPFEDKSMSDNTNLITYGRDLIKSGGEIGIHGYNHQSLTINPDVAEAYGYKLWRDQESMEGSVRTALNFIQHTFPNYSIHNYVPPSNVLGDEGREALKNAWPGLKSISAVYSEDATKLSYVQEFEVAEDGIVELPRVTSGFKEDEFMEWAMSNAVSSIGVFSHFIHPDDILDRERSFPYTWEELVQMFTDYMELTDSKYGWLRSMTASEASMEFERYEMSEPHFVHKPGKIQGYINHYAGGKLYYYLRSDKKVTKQINCRTQRIDDETYLVEVDHSTFTIELGD